MNLLIVVDMQNDFIDGALGTKEAQAIVPRVCAKIKAFDGAVYYTQDTHFEDYLDTIEGEHLPIMHCLKESHGWQVNSQIMTELIHKHAQVIEKYTFGSLDLLEKLEEIHQREGIERITLVGLCTDICVISNALLLKAKFLDIPIEVDATACAGVTLESHKNALQAMKMCHIDVMES
ncbi:cysteine hydrolase family protein [Granulicatella seriolae]|uniref:Cysteine hydrolase n=2 Tax=Granulicatella seriolae TaxID=2967226 RepID=A0ABT1WNV3_9LACT|nr:isochorismatase family cysteine hydrolase [Granulicatella seriolae]